MPVLQIHVLGGEFAPVFLKSRTLSEPSRFWRVAWAKHAREKLLLPPTIDLVVMLSFRFIY